MNSTYAISTRSIFYFFNKFAFKIKASMNFLTQGVEGGDVLPHVGGPVRPRLPQQGVHVVTEAHTRHLGRVHGDGEEVLMAAQVHLRAGNR